MLFAQRTQRKAQVIQWTALIDGGVVTVLMILLAGAPLYQMIHSTNDKVFASDYPDHLRFIQKAALDGSWEPHFLFQWTVYALSGFRSTFIALSWSMFGIILACLIAKGLLTLRCYRLAAAACQDPLDRSFRTGRLVLPLALTSCLLMPIITPVRPQDVYLGQVAPNLWHNPTVIFAWPLVILLFFFGLDFLERRRSAILIAVAVLFLLNTVAKPNFVLAFGPVFSVACLYRFGFSRRFLLEQTALVPTVLVLAAQAHWTYSHANPATASSIVLAPLAAWRSRSHWITLSILRSIAFPLAYLILRPDRLRDSARLGMAWLTFGSALAWALLFAESGPRLRDFNFLWGAHLALFVLFAATIMDYLCSPSRAPRTLFRSEVWLWLLFGLHLLSGILYFLKIGVGLGYL